MDATALGTSMLMMQMMQVAQSYGALYTILFLVALQVRDGMYLTTHTHS
jgi:hypothetical protein